MRNWHLDRIHNSMAALRRVSGSATEQVKTHLKGAASRAKASAYLWKLSAGSVVAEYKATARVTTAAYQAERDLDRLMYQDTGLYRNQQYAKASTVILQTMYEEIPILWDQELKYRPSFSAAGDTVTLPVICQKICGVKDGNASQYWLDIKKLITPDTEVVRSVPWVQGTDPNPVKPYATQFLKNGKLLRSKIKAHSAYLYGILRAEVQEHLLDKLQLLLDQKLIRGTFENGTEYTVIATALNLPKDLLRKIQAHLHQHHGEDDLPGGQHPHRVFEPGGIRRAVLRPHRLPVHRAALRPPLRRRDADRGLPLRSADP